MVLDSNIIIYAAQAEHDTLRQFIADHTPAVSVISVTHNTDDFRWISEIKLLDPLAERP